MTHSELLYYYDHHLCTDTEALGAHRITRVGPLWVLTYADSVTITHGPLGLTDGDTLWSLVDDGVQTALDQRPSPDSSIEWKTRSHDPENPVLTDCLRDLGFAPEAEENVMLGRIETVLDSLGAPEPDGIRVFEISPHLDAFQMQQHIRSIQWALNKTFGMDHALSAKVLEQEIHSDSSSVWVACSPAGETVGVGRATWHTPSSSVSLWGGGVIPQWRGQGVYRALLHARLRKAQEHGCVYVHSDSTSQSAPIHIRIGMLRVTGTTPWILES